MSAIWKASKVHQGIIVCWEKPKTGQPGQNAEKIQKTVKKITTAMDYDKCKK